MRAHRDGNYRNEYFVVFQNLHDKETDVQLDITFLRSVYDLSVSVHIRAH
jgi:hypothetical protein